MKITTNQAQVPWSWVAIVLFPWFAFMIREPISNAGMTYTLKKFIDDPVIIGAVLSTNSLFSLSVGSIIAFLSDHIWTRWGRRRPFLIFSFFGAAILSLFIPLVHVPWLILGIIVLYQLVVDFSGSYEPFTMEIIPPHQRGRAGAMTHWYKTIGASATMAFLIGHFDFVYNLGFATVNGEQVMYWTNSLFLVVAGCIVLFLVREQKPKDYVKKSIPKILFQRFAVEITRPTMLRLMGLAMAMQALWLGLAQFEPLLVTEQWGYQKNSYGYIITSSTIITMVLVPLAGHLSDRFDRMSLLKFGMITVVVLKVIFYCVVEFAVEGQPPMAAVFALGFLKSTLGSFMAVLCVPLLFDYVSNNRLGTLGCAMGIVFGLAGFVGTNAMGFWIKFSSRTIYGLPEGEYNYLAGYHWPIFVGIVGFIYIYIFQRWENRGVIARVKRDEADTTEDPVQSEG
jgi:MFS family permease